MTAVAILRDLKRVDVRRIAIITVLVMLMISSAGVMTDDAEAQGPGRKDITLYLHNVTTSKQVGSISTLRIMNTTIGSSLNTTVQTSNSVQDDWYVYPVLANDTTIRGNVTLHIWALRTARTGDNRGATLGFTLYDVDSTGTDVGTIATASTNVNMINDWKEYSIAATGVSNYTVQSGHSMRLYFLLSGSSSNYYQIAWGDNTKKSRLDIETYDWVRTNGVEVRDHLGIARTIFLQTVSNKDITFHANITDPYGGYDIRYVNATLVAPNGTTLLDKVKMTKTSGYFNSYYSEFELSWNYSGQPTGEYRLTVSAVDNTGYYYRYPTNPGDATYGGHLVSQTTTFRIGGMPHDATVTVRDNGGGPLVGALVTFGDESGLTGGTGAVTLKLANGTYSLTVHWQDVLVYSGVATVSGDTSISVTAAVFSPQLAAVDDAGDPVEDAVVFMQHPNGTFMSTFWRTDAGGLVNLTQMAGGSYRISVLWRGVEVFNASVTLSADTQYRLDLSIYIIDVRVEDEVGDGIALAQVVVTDHRTGIVTDSKLTNLTGVATVRLPVGSYDFTVYWRNILVFEELEDYLVDASGTIVLGAKVLDVNLVVRDTMDQALATARVVIGFAATGEVQDFGTTNDTGELGTKLPVGSFDIWVYWRDVLVNETRGLLIDASGDVLVVASVYWVDLTTVDSRDVPVPSAIVSMRHADGVDFGAKGTDDAGQVSYRLPGGSFQVDVAWQESPVHSSVRVIDSNDPVILHVSVFYLELTVEDTLAVALEGAMVSVRNVTTARGMGSATTDADGYAMFRLPRGVYGLSVVWQESIVYSGDRALASDLDITLTASVYYLNLHLVDSRLVPVEGAVVTVTNASTGRIMGSPVTSEDGNVTLRLPMGDYHERVVWQETVVYEGDRRVEGNEPHVMGVAIYYADIHVQDSMTIALEGAAITFSNATTGKPMGTRLTDEDGNASYRVPVGDYELEVIWQESTVNTSLVLVRSDISLVVDARVFYADLMTVDTTGAVLSGAQVTVTSNATGRIMGTQVSDADGKVLYRLPMGDYGVEVVWQETVVYMEILTFDDNDPITLVTFVFQFTVEVLDSKDAAVESALVLLTNTSSGRSMGERVTDSEGTVDYRLPGGQYALLVSWQDVVVFDGSLSVINNNRKTVPVMVYYPTFHVEDSQDVPLENALVTVTMVGNGRIFGSQLTDSDGMTTFRIPVGTYSADVVWLDSPVFEDVFIIDANEVHTLEASVFYVTLSAVDSNEAGLEWAQAFVVNSTSLRSMGGKTLDGSGMNTFRLPIGVYDIHITWQQADIYDGTWTVDQDATFTLDCRVYYLTTRAADADDLDVENAMVSLSSGLSGTFYGPTSTDEEGLAQFRLPEGTYSLAVTWRTIQVYEDEALVVDGDAQVDLDCRVYYLTVEVIGSDGSGVGNADVNVMRAGEVAFDSAITPNDGKVVFRLPGDDYSVNMTFRATYYLTRIDVSKGEDVSLTSNQTVTFKLSKDEFPLPFYKTNLFWLVLGFVLLILLLLFLVFHIRKAAMADEEGSGEETATEEPSESEDDDLNNLLEDLEDGEEPESVSYVDEDLEDVEYDENGDEVHRISEPDED